MAFDFHKDKKTYIKYQYENARQYVIPFIEEGIKLKEGARVLEIGCAEGGVIKAFIEKGFHGTGVELMPARYEMAKQTLKKEIDQDICQLLQKNIYDVQIGVDIEAPFDLIILKDVIEHIHDQDKILNKLREFLNKDGCIFFGFPPWYMPFGGHQQIAKNKFLSKLPYYHLLPMGIYKSFLKLFGENERTVNDLAEIKETGISIERFEKLCKKNSYSILKRTYYLINPIYIYKFGLKARKQFWIIKKIPYLRDFLTTCMYYLVKKEA